MDNHNSEVLKYYRKSESRIGYQLVLNGIRHFGWYPGDGSLGRWHFGVAQRNMERLLGRRLQLEAGARVLDAGCGEGHVARTLCEEFGLTIAGIDLVPDSIEIARRLVAGTSVENRLSFTVGTYQNIDFPNEQFDAAYTMETFVHSVDPAGALAELYRVLQPGGRLVMFEYSSTPKEQVGVAAYAALERVCDLAAMPGWLELTHGRLEELAVAAGFEVQSVEDLTDNMMPMLNAFSLIARAPFWALGLMGKQDRAVNAMSAVEMFRYPEVWRYNLYVLRKS